MKGTKSLRRSARIFGENHILANDKEHKIQLDLREEALRAASGDPKVEEIAQVVQNGHLAIADFGNREEFHADIQVSTDPLKVIKQDFQILNNKFGKFEHTFEVAIGRVLQTPKDIEEATELSITSSTTTTFLILDTDSYTYLPNFATFTGPFSTILPTTTNNNTNNNLTDNMDSMNFHHDELEYFTYEEEDLISNSDNDEFLTPEDYQFAASICDDNCSGAYLHSALPHLFGHSPVPILSGFAGLDRPHDLLDFTQLISSPELYSKFTILLLSYYYIITNSLSVYIFTHYKILTWDPGILLYYVTTFVLTSQY